ncbi:hypothetical protein GCM10027290_38410 [Micromonospora sonneratiae]
MTPPAAPVITSPTPGQVVNDSTPTITGTGEPGNTITVTIDGVVAGTTTVAPDGTWSFNVPMDLTEGSHTVTATQTDAAGNVSPPSDPVTFTVDTTGPAAPVITNPTNGQQVNDRTPIVTGTGEPGATVSVTVNGVVVGTGAVGPDGTWSVTVDRELGCGQQTITATQTDVAGIVSPTSAPVTFTVVCRDLPVTGGTPVGVVTLTLIGLLSVGAGVLLVRWRRRA